MNKQNKKNKLVKAAGKSLAAAYVAQGSRVARQERIEAGIDIIEQAVAGDTSDFLTIGYAVNPGIEARFASLSQEAKRYDAYEFTDLAFKFIGTTVISTTPGQIGLAFDPNPNSQPPNTQARFSAYECHNSSSVYKPDGLTLRVPKHMLAGRRFVRSGPVGSNLCLYDPGTLIIMVRNESSTDTIGYVEVAYKVRFFDFHLEPQAQPRSHTTVMFTRAADQTLPTTTETTWEVDTVTIPGLEYDLSSGVVTLAPGVYHVIAALQLSDSANETFAAIGKIVAAGDGWSGVELAKMSLNNSAPGGASYLEMMLHAVFGYNESVQVQIDVTLTGAAGTLKVENESKLIIQAL
jgi:hypothetical protein